MDLSIALKAIQMMLYGKLRGSLVIDKSWDMGGLWIDG